VNVLGIIPARYGSTRLEGKPLLDIAGMSMIERVYCQCLKVDTFAQVIVATDDERIYNYCSSKKIDVMMSSVHHINGTERCAEVVDSLKSQFDLIINIQGDEPFISPESIVELIELFKQNDQIKIGTLKKKINSNDDILNPNIIKVVSAENKKAIYFSRNPIPYMRDVELENYSTSFQFYKHIGMYAYKPNVLLDIVKLKESPLEKAEKLEQLRWLENGYDIYVNETKFESKSIDTREDYEYLIKNIHLYE
jgi:3-deoxy-manno-octulosonate cytidylyltransferase (CMP-KDO synthetase)